VSYDAATFTLKVTKGGGLVVISKAGCGDSQIDLTISPAGDISGQGEFKCFAVTQAAGHQAALTGPLTIGGRIADRQATLLLRPRVGSEVSVVLPLSAN